MKQRKKIHHILLTVGLVLLLALFWSYCLRLFWQYPNLNFKYDWGYSLTDWSHMWWGSVNAWNDWFLGSAVMVNAAWLISVVVVFLAKISALSVTAYMGVLLVVLFTLAAWGMANLLRQCGVRWWLAWMFGLIYALAPFGWIRVVIGFLYSIMGIAIAPWLLWLWIRTIPVGSKRYGWYIIPVLTALLAAQPQYVIMVGFVCLLDIIFTPDNSYRWRGVKLLALSGVVTVVAHLPWLSLLLRSSNGSVGAVNEVGGSIETINSIPHSALRTLIGADHHITYKLIDQLLGVHWYAAAAIGLVIMALLAPLLARRKPLVTVSTVALAIGWVMGLGPQIPTSRLFVWVYNHLPLNNIFREVYHWSWLITFALVVLAAASLEQLAKRKVGGVVSLVLAAVVLVGWAVPWQRGDFYGFITPLKLPAGYQQISLSEQVAAQTLTRSFFLPSLGFVAFDTDKTPGAANSDIYSISTNRNQLPSASSLLDFPSPAQEIRDAALMALRTPDAGDFTGYMRVTAVDRVYDRTTMQSKFTELFTLPSQRLSEVRDWSNPAYGRLLNQVGGVSLTRRLEGVNEYKVTDASPLVTYAKRNIIAADDWRLVANNSDAAVFFASDLGEQAWPSGQIMGEDKDLVASLLQPYNVVSTVSAGAVLPRDGFVRKSAVWWWTPALTTIKGGYIFTMNNSTATTVSLNSGEYTIWAKYWSSRYAKTLDITVDQNRWNWPTVSDSAGSWEWREVGSFSTGAKQAEVTINGQGEAGLAALIVVPKEQLLAAQNRVAVAQKAQSTDIVAVANPAITKQSPSHYVVSLNNKQPATLIVRVGYDAGWRLYTSAGTLSPIKVDGYAMAFIVPALNEKATLEFVPQRSYHALEVIAWLMVGTLLILAFKPTPRQPK